MNFWTFLDRNSFEAGMVVVFLLFFGTMGYMHAVTAETQCPKSTAAAISEE